MKKYFALIISVIVILTCFTACKPKLKGGEVVTNAAGEGFAAVTNPKFEVYADKAGEFRFRLKARNGEIIATSEGYKAKSSCLNGIESVRKNAPEAAVVKED